MTKAINGDWCDVATTGFWPVKGKLKSVISYAANPDKTTELKGVDKDLLDTINYAANSSKTDETLYVSGINCPKQRAYECMMETKRKYGKLGGNVAYHGFQSFKTGEVTPEEAHKIGLETARRMWGDKYEIVVTTHLNTENLHNHFVVNSVSFKDGRKFENHISDHYKLRDISDELCKEYGKSVLENAPLYKNESKFYWLRQNGGLSPLDKFREDAEIARGYAMFYNQFINNLSYLGYKFYNAKWNKHDTVIVPGIKNPVRLSSLGEEYTLRGFKPKEPKKFIMLPVIDIYFKKYKRKTMWDSLYNIWMMILDLIEYLITQNRENGNINVPLSPELRAEIKDFDKIHKEYTFITDNKVYTQEDLTIYIAEKTDEISALEAERQHIYNLCRRPKSDEDLELNKAKAREISKELRLLRADLKFAEGLPDRQNKLFNALQQEYAMEYPNRRLKLEKER